MGLTLRGDRVLCQHRIILDTPVAPTDREGTWGAGCWHSWASEVHQSQPRALQLQWAGAGYGRNACSSKSSWRKTRAMVAEKFLGYIFFSYSCGLKPQQLARLPREGSSKAFPKSQPHPLLPSPAVSVFLTFFPSLPSEQMQFGKRQATVTAPAERVFDSRGWL